MYSVIRCFNCKKFQLSSANKIFSCVYCKKTKEITRIRIYYQSQTPQLAQEVLKKIKEELSSDDSGFKSALE